MDIYSQSLNGRSGQTCVWNSVFFSHYFHFAHGRERDGNEGEIPLVIIVAPIQILWI